MKLSLTPRAGWLAALAWVLLTSGAYAATGGTCPDPGSLSVTATAGSSTPDWASADVGDQGQPPEESDTPLNASLSGNPPTPCYGCTLNGPYWSWTIDYANIQKSQDGQNWTYDSSGFSGYIDQPSSSSPSATLRATFSDGAYWQIPCVATVEYDDGSCGHVWMASSPMVAQTNVGPPAPPAKAAPKSITFRNLTVISGATQDNVSGVENWACVKKAGEKVTVEATIRPNTDEAANQIQWTGGDAVATNKRQRTVDRGTSPAAPTTVQAKVKNTTKKVVIWVLWVTIENKVAGMTPANAVQFGDRYDGTENLGFRRYDTNRKAVGKVVPIGTITPAGVKDVVKDGWEFKRDRWSHDFKDGARSTVYYDTDWTDDTSDPSFQKLVPDANDKIYDRDAPSIGLATVTDSYETYNNFREFVKWNGDSASDYAGWYFKARRKLTENPQIVDGTVDTGSITLPTAASYPPP